MSTFDPDKSKSIYWQRKLSAYLHDSPDKAVAILGHEKRTLFHAFDLADDEQFRKEADFGASAADRIPFPDSRRGKTDCQSTYDPTENPFRHPLSGDPIQLDNINHDQEGEQHRTMPSLHGDEFDIDHYRRTFFALWRFWQNWSSDANPEFAFYPAETRLPDHNIWSHLGITSAMQGCCGGSKEDWDPKNKREKRSLPDSPALLLFSIGPVQDFIAAARTTRDLWSGSYLLSYLVSSALGQIAKDFGPDHIIFPNLKGQPLIDLALCEDWENSGASKKHDFWTSFDYTSNAGKDFLLTPSLPNRFLALLPNQMTEQEQWANAAEYAKHLAEDIRDELSAIADSISKNLDGDPCFHKPRFNQQVEDLLEIHWQLLPVPDSISEIQEKAKELPSDENFQPLSGLKAVLDMVKTMPAEHRDDRYFAKGNVGDKEHPEELNQATAAWPALYALAGWQLDGVKSMRIFHASNEGSWEKGRDHNKDSLTGREEACLIAPDNAEDCEEIRKAIAPDAAKESIKPNEFLGAATLIKRFWHLTRLKEEYGFRAEDFKMPNTHAIADHQPFNNSSEQAGGNEESAKYYAVIAFDGDRMGQWISGAKCPKMGDLLSEEATAYFKNNGNAKFLEERRPLSPSFHLQFSEMLGNFSLYCARRIVEAFDGRLIYAGGDDVLAMLPADTSLDCAAALRAAFRGDGKLASDLPDLFQKAPTGCIRLTEESARKKEDGSDPLISDPHRFPVLVPGPKTDVSAGIAIGHIKSPLQDLVKAAQDAEKRAKNELNRAACAISIFKRSGEIQHWGFKWTDPDARTAPVLPLLKTLLKAIKDKTMSNRFPYRMIELLMPYLNQRDNDKEILEMPVDSEFSSRAGDIVKIELSRCLEQHLTGEGDISNKNVLESFDIYWASLDTEKEKDGRGLAQVPEEKIRDFVGLLSTLAWISKHKVTENQTQ